MWLVSKGKVCPLGQYMKIQVKTNAYILARVGIRSCGWLPSFWKEKRNAEKCVVELETLVLLQPSRLHRGEPSCWSRAKDGSPGTLPSSPIPRSWLSGRDLLPRGCGVGSVWGNPRPCFSPHVLATQCSCSNVCPSSSVTDNKSSSFERIGGCALLSLAQRN